MGENSRVGVFELPERIVDLRVLGGLLCDSGLQWRYEFIDAN